MKKISYLILLIISLTGYAFVCLLTQNWDLNTGYVVKFVNPEATGTFEKMTAEISFDEKDLPNSHFDVRIDVNSINLGSPELSKQALSPDMLNAHKFPLIHFVSSAVQKAGTGYIVKGSLELHGVKKDIEIPFTFLTKVFKGGFEIKAKDYGINSLGNGQEDILKLDLSVLVKEAPAQSGK